MEEKDHQKIVTISTFQFVLLASSKIGQKLNFAHANVSVLDFFVYFKLKETYLLDKTKVKLLLLL